MDHNPILMKAKPYLREETMNKIEELIIFLNRNIKIIYNMSVRMKLNLD